MTALEVNGRYDGSSKYMSGDRWGFFPSVSAGWRISEEQFWKENENLSFINNLKLKASYGILGNNNIGNYPYQSVYSLGQAQNYVFGGVYTQGAAVTTYVDPGLKWERTRTTDVGIETAFFNNKLTFNASYFYRKTTDVLYKPAASYSSIFGLSVSQVNTGELENKGWEFEIGHQNTIGKFHYHINGNFSIIDKDGKKIGYARSVWAMISLNTRKPADLLTLHGGSIVDYVCDEPCPIEKPSRIKVTSDRPVATLTAKYSDIDINGHVNSIRYIEHILDLFPIDLYKTKRIRRFEMAYVAESYFGDELSFFCDEANSNEFHVEVKKNGSEVVCRSKVIFE